MCVCVCVCVCVLFFSLVFHENSSKISRGNDRDRSPPFLLGANWEQVLGKGKRETATPRDFRSGTLRNVYGRVFRFEFNAWIVLLDHRRAVGSTRLRGLKFRAGA